MDTRRYLEGLWHACEALVRQAADGSACELRRETVLCLHQLHSQHADAASFTVATGAAAGAINGVPDSVAQNMELSQARGLALYLRNMTYKAINEVIIPSRG